MTQDSRTKMVRSAAKLIRKRGVNAASFSEVLADSGAPRGSIYHYFPDGKEQLAAEAIRWISSQMLEHQRACADSTPNGVLGCFIEMWRQVVRASGGAAGCVVAGTAIDLTADQAPLMRVVRETFRTWIETLSDQLERAGLPRDRAAAVALAAIAGMEGALILCRSEGSPKPLETVAAELMRLLPAEA